MSRIFVTSTKAVDPLSRTNTDRISHHQYELQLGKWDERKYLTAIEWIRTFQFIDQYRKAGQDCQVFMNGKKVEERLLRKKQRLWSKRPGYAEATRGRSRQAISPWYSLMTLLQSQRAIYQDVLLFAQKLDILVWPPQTLMSSMILHPPQSKLRWPRMRLSRLLIRSLL